MGSAAVGPGAVGSAAGLLQCSLELGEQQCCSAQELLQVSAGQTAAQGRGFVVGRLSCNLQSWCFSNGEKEES